jgi:hypothetical protein
MDPPKEVEPEKKREMHHRSLGREELQRAGYSELPQTQVRERQDHDLRKWHKGRGKSTIARGAKDWAKKGGSAVYDF